MNQDLESVIAIAVVVGLVLGAIGLVLASYGPALVGHFTIMWARLCSLPRPRTVRDRYAAEMRSHVSQHFNDPDMFGRTPGQLALRLLVDTTAGMPGDMLWALQGIADRVRRRPSLGRGAIESPATLELEPIVEVPSTPLDREVAVQKEVHGVTGFLPSTHGLHFANRFPPGPTVRFGPLDPRWIGIGGATAGLSGGMAWFVRERFGAGLPIPPDTKAPANGSRLFQALVRRQVRSIEWMRVPLGFWWMGAQGPRGVARRTRENECPKILATIDAGHLAMVGLIRHQGLNPSNIAKSHQVVAYAYQIEEDTIRLRIYDPNWPDRDDVEIIIEPGMIRQSTREPLFGILALI